MWAHRAVRSFRLVSSSIARFVTDAPLRIAGSALESNKAPKSRIREAVLSGFDVTRKPVFESRVSSNRDDEVVPAMELTQRQLAFKPFVALEKLRCRLTCVGIEHVDFGVAGGYVGDPPSD